MTVENDEILDPVERIVSEDATYACGAYYFVLAVVETTISALPARRHITGRELLEAMRELGLARYGLMTKVVFEHWGVRSTEDFGRIVFRLVDAGLLSKTPEDSMEDFTGVYDFEEAFVVGVPWNRSDWDV